MNFYKGMADTTLHTPIPSQTDWTRGYRMPRNEADVIVIGGGITGSSIALRLAEKGQRVILLEKGRVGEEASGRAGGCVRQAERPGAELPLAMEAIKIWANMPDELDQ